MESLLKALLEPVLVSIGALLFVGAPVIALLWWLIHKKTRWEACRELPISEYPARPPGESLRVRIADLEEKHGDFVLPLLVVPSLIAVTLSTNPLFRSWPYWLGGLVVVLGIVKRYGPRIIQSSRELHAHRLGFLGERVVGETLNQLMRRGYHVFHDVPFDQNNIDHVVVCRAGVFAIETKTRSVKREGDDADRGAVTYDGECLVWPGGFAEVDWLSQAKRQARQLHDYILEKTGYDHWVDPVVVIPGWDVARKATGTVVRVLDEKEVLVCFPDEAKLTEVQINKFAAVLAEKCRIDGDRSKLSTRDTKARQRFRFGLVKARTRTNRYVRR